MVKYDLVESQALLNRHCTDIIDGEAQVLFMDCEFVSNAKRYYPKLSVIQIEYDQKIIIIDIIKKNDFSLLKEILQNKSICKVMHSPYQDIEAIHSSLGCHINNVFDIQMAYAFISSERSISYGGIVQNYCGVKIDKECQRSNWVLRPLTRSQLHYSANDVAYLRAVYENIVRDLESKDKMLWFREEMEREMINHKIKLLDPSRTTTNIAKNFGESVSNLVTFQILKIREMIAIKYNVHRNSVITNRNIAKFTDHIASEGGAARFIDVNDLCVVASKKVEEEYVNEFVVLLLDFFKRSIGESEFLTIQRNNITYSDLNACRHSALFKRLYELLSDTAKEYGIAKSMIATVDDVLTICMNNAIERKFTSGWRYKVFGERAADILLSKNY